MKGLGLLFCASGLLAISAIPATAQTTPTAAWARSQEVAQLAASRTARLNHALPADPFADASGASLSRQGAVSTASNPAFGSDLEFGDTAPAGRFGVEGRRSSALEAVSRSDLWSEGNGHFDRLRLTTRGTLRRADGSPLPPTLRDEAQFEADAYDVSFTRGWPVARAYTPSGLEISLTPHAGLGVGADGTSAEAGATLKIGSDIERMVPDGSREFGQRSRWYVYAAGSGRAVGYNFARTRDGDFARSGVSHDSGSFLGDASVGLAMRRGDMQTSLGVVYREITADGLRGGEGFDRDVAEGLVAFQFSIKPQR